ncbi:MAG: ABC transporter ATP-binding protein [Muribaculaceae bacterium]|nr:ABC transporter ATP-binding protein [Muribaculaceae bacterium]
MGTPILSTSQLTIGYGGNAVQTDLNLEVRRGEMVCLLGPNGAGKSTLLRTVSGVQPPLGGMVMIDNKLLRAYSPRELARKVALVYTDTTMAGALTVRELVALGRQPHTGFFGRLHSDDRQKVDEAMSIAGIGSLASKMVAQLSDGERQKAMIARALAQQTPLIVMDEPTAFLDVASRLEVMSLLKQLSREHGVSMLISTHDVASAVTMADTLWLMRKDGGVISGTPAQLATDENGLPSLFADRHVVYDPTASDFRPKF